MTDQTDLGIGKVELHANHDPNRKMLGAEWTGKRSITVNQRDVPVVTDPVRWMFQPDCAVPACTVLLWDLACGRLLFQSRCQALHVHPGRCIC